MGKTPIKNIISVTEELHDDITEIYEELMDDENEKALIKIDETMKKLKHLKSNLVTKDK